MIGRYVTRRHHLAELRRVRNQAADQLARTVETAERTADNKARRRAASWLYGVAESYRLDAALLDAAHQPRRGRTGGLTASQRLAVQHEIENVARDLLEGEHQS